MYLGNVLHLDEPEVHNSRTLNAKGYDSIKYKGNYYLFSMEQVYPDEVSGTCVYCTVKRIQVVLIPCGHMCLCKDCAEPFTGACPICRADIAGKFRVYMTEFEIKSALRETRGNVQAAAELLASIKRSAKEMNKRPDENTGKEEKDPVSPKGPLEPPIKRARTEETWKILAILMGEENLDGIDKKAKALEQLDIEKIALEKLNRDYALARGTLPVQIEYFENLKSLVCSDDSLRELPAVIGNLKNLEVLICDNNELTSLPVQIWQLSQLKTLDCGYNELTSLPSEIGKLGELAEFYCNDNKLTSLPMEIGNLSQLQDLNCSGNKLTSLPMEIGNLSQLDDLNCSNNKLTSLPMGIGNLSQLEVLNCSNNQLTSLPMEIGNLSQLMELNCKNNQLTSLPVEIILLNIKFLKSDFEVSPPQTHQMFMLKTMKYSQNKDTMLEFMEGIKLNPLVMSLTKSNMFLIHIDKEAMQESPAYVTDFLDLIELPEYDSLEFKGQIRDYLKDKKGPHLLALVSVNDNTPLLNGFLLGTFFKEDFGKFVKKASKDRKNLAEISFLSTAKPSYEVSENYFSVDESYYFGTMLVKIFESMAREAGKKNLILHSMETALKFYEKLGFEDTGFRLPDDRADRLPDDPVIILTKEVSVPLDPNADVPLWHQVLEARRAKMMAEAIILSGGNLVAAAQLVWHRIN